MTFCIERRLAVIQELLRITCPGGFVMIHAWAQEQGDGNVILYYTSPHHVLPSKRITNLNNLEPNLRTFIRHDGDLSDSRHEFPEQDMLVPWRLQKRFFLPGQSGSGISSSDGAGQGQGLPGDERTSSGMTVATTKKFPSKSAIDGNGSSNGFQQKKQRRKKKSKRPLIPKTEGDTSASDGQIAGTVTDAKLPSDLSSDGDDSESVDAAATDLETDTATEDIDGNVGTGGGLCASVQGLELSATVPPPANGVVEVESVEQSQPSFSSSSTTVSSVVAALSTVSPDGPCEHMVEDEQKGQVIITNPRTP